MQSPPIDLFYQRLLDLNRHERVEPLVEEALALVVELANAKLAYLEIYADDDASSFRSAHNGDADETRAKISRGIIARSIADGETISTTSAMLDARFERQASVRQHAICSVLCAPIGSAGVVYLQGDTPFAPVDRARVERFAHELAAIADRIVPRTPLTLADEIELLKTRRIREALERHDWNVASAAAELGVARTTVYRVLPRARRSRV